MNKSKVWFPSLIALCILVWAIYWSAASPESTSVTVISASVGIAICVFVAFLNYVKAK